MLAPPQARPAVGLEGPGHLEDSAVRAQRAVLGRVGRQFVDNHAERQRPGRVEVDDGPVQRDPLGVGLELAAHHGAQVGAAPGAGGEHVVGAGEGHQPPLEIADEGRHVGRVAGRLRRHGLHGGQVVLHPVIEFVEQELLLLGEDGALGHVAALGDDAGDAALLVPDGLVDEVHVAHLDLPAGRVLQRHGQRAAGERLAGGEDPVEDLEQPGWGDLGQGLASRHSDHVAVPDELAVGGVGQAEDVVRPIQHGHEARRLLEQRKQPLALFAVALLARGERFHRLAQAVLGQHPAGGLDAGAEHAPHRAGLVGQGTVGEGEEGRLGIAVALHQEGQVLLPDALAVERRADQGLQVGPDLGPDLLEPQAEGGGVPGAQDRRVGVVVDEGELGAPGDEHRLLGVQHHRRGGPQGLGPGGGVAERRARPVVGAHERAHRPAALEEARNRHRTPRAIARAGAPSGALRHEPAGHLRVMLVPRTVGVRRRTHNPAQWFSRGGVQHCRGVFRTLQPKAVHPFPASQCPA
ncbi:conserved hypothetical protein [Phenylobacterium zucineum HLK1]|uniref:Uncharacterized protein n=1 Tax=Phenylobacterium zucineum (strain HLK1) TaxID=450851 RepID=B4RAV2_PHEZH|nr:conserved hypothetical protein [Phenylobacterium zucineum HLK1]